MTGIDPTYTNSGDVAIIDQFGSSTMWTEQSDSPSLCVLDAVANHLDVSPIELPPLYESVDPEVLDQIFSTTSSGMRMGTIRFSYAGHLICVTIGSDVSVSIESREEDVREPIEGEGRD